MYEAKVETTVARILATRQRTGDPQTRGLILLPLREKVARGARRMRGETPLRPASR